MSASLVGSEMCIRDSVPAAVTPDQLSQKRACVRACVRAWPHAGGLCGGCLLYTSDAADDM
eukprot:8979028-Alexandrium_andersonii.AAC.1